MQHNQVTTENRSFKKKQLEVNCQHIESDLKKINSHLEMIAKSKSQIMKHTTPTPEEEKKYRDFLNDCGKSISLCKLYCEKYIKSIEDLLNNPLFEDPYFIAVKTRLGNIKEMMKSMITGKAYQKTPEKKDKTVYTNKKKAQAFL